MRRLGMVGTALIVLLVAAGMAHAAGAPETPPGLERALGAQQAHNPRLLSVPGVVGTAVGLTGEGRPAVRVFTERAGTTGVPRSLDGVPVEVQVTGKIYALAPPEGKGPPNRAPKVAIASPKDGETFGSGTSILFEGTATDKEDGDLTADLVWTANGVEIGTGGQFYATLDDGDYSVTTTATDAGGLTGLDSVTISVGGGTGDAPEPGTTERWPRPVPIGVSTGNANECSAGTIGARVRDATGNVYALSNNHVYARENEAALGEEALQPGLYDTGCVYDPDNQLGALAAFVAIVFDGTTANYVDAAIALTSADRLGRATPSAGYGAPKAATASAEVGLAVQKFGRTTEWTEGVVTGVNASIKVGYTSGTALFEDQVVVEARKLFLKSGDSGSLLVSQPGRNPVGLLFAGNRNGKLAVANRIDRVLDALGVAVDGE